MRRLSLSVFAALAVLALAITGCGSSGEPKEGGTVTILDTAGGVDSLDPGVWYYQTDYKELGNTTQRQLYGWKPSETTPTPDLATALPQVSDGGKTITIKIRPGIKYSPPLQTRTVKAADVKYALDRCIKPEPVENGYSGSYYSTIVGAQDVIDGKADEVKGITAPDDATLVIKTTDPTGILANGSALGMPCTSPVPKDYAAKYDSGSKSTYGEHAVFTGPYMIENDGKGNVIGYEAGKRLTLVRNPSWDKKTDFKPAHFDRIEVKGGFDATIAARRTLTGKSLLSGDYAAPPVAVLKSALGSRKDQVSIQPSTGNRYISLNTKVKPLDDVNVRRALSAAIDRTALRQTRGGPTLGTVATHFISPGVAGFEEAGGVKGPGVDFTSNPKANLALAQEYLEKAGYKDGKYSGPELLTFSDNESPAKETGEAFQAQVAKLGFKLKLREVPHADLSTKYCGVPKAAVAICPTLGWGPDFFSPQSMIDPLFNGKNIVPTNNVNSAQVDDPKLNAEIEKAKRITDPAAAAKAWAELDKKVTDQSYFITWLWDNNVNLHSTDVNGVPSKFNSGDWDLTFSSLEK
jgi:peptide/nickel transport system substrate-binding protein